MVRNTISCTKIPLKSWASNGVHSSRSEARSVKTGHSKTWLPELKRLSSGPSSIPAQALAPRVISTSAVDSLELLSIRVECTRARWIADLIWLKSVSRSGASERDNLLGIWKRFILSMMPWILARKTDISRIVFGHKPYRCLPLEIQLVYPLHYLQSDLTK
jgi:hypothetical protein